MVHRILGILDLICVIALIFPTEINIIFTLICGLYLIIKGAIFLFGKDIISSIDVLIGIYLIIAGFGSFNLIPTIVSIIFLTQKGILSLLR